MNRKQAEDNVGELVRLDYWPFTLSHPVGVGLRWRLHQVTKGGMCVISGENNRAEIQVSPSCLSELK